jgi:hypothetical protein
MENNVTYFIHFTDVGKPGPDFVMIIVKINLQLSENTTCTARKAGTAYTFGAPQFTIVCVLFHVNNNHGRDNHN